jgi:hypothetical protein
MLPSQKKDGHFIDWLPFLFVAGYSIAATLLRAGFSDRYVSEILHLGGLSLLVLSLPKVLKEKFEKVGVISEGLISIAMILAFAVLAIIPGSKLLSLGLSISGLALFLFRNPSQIKLVNFSSAFFIILYTFFSLWIVSVIWGGYHLRPTFIETLVVSKPYFFDQEFYNGDTLYNLSIAQMIKNYGVASTGLDGTPSIYYHYGCHWIMAQLSKFTGIHLVHVYNFGYPLIFIPLFFSIFLQFIFQVQEWLFKKTDGELLFLLLLMCLFIGVPNHLYAGGLLGISGLVNDSFVISLIILFAFLHTGLLFWQSHTKNVWLFTFLTFLFVVAAGIVKISTGFVLTGLLCYLFIRFGLYLQLRCWVCLLIVIGGFLFTYWMTAETLPFGIRKVGGDEGIQQYLHFYKHTHTFEPVSWFGGFYLWLYLTVFLVFVLLPSSGGKSRIRYLWKNKMMLPAEILVVVALVGVLPSLLIAFNGGNSMYFSGIQLFVAGAFVLGFVPALSDKVIAWSSMVKKPVSLSIKFILVVSLLLLLYKEVRWDFNKMIKINVQTRRELLGIPVDPDWRVKYDQSTFGIFSKPVHQAYDTIKFGKFVSALMEQEKNTVSSQLLFLNHQTLPIDFFRNIRCIETSFIGPAFSGHAMLDGLSYNCGIGMYGDGYYQHNFAGVPNPSQNQICNKAASKGFTQVVGFDCTKNQFQLIDCRPR